MSEEKKSNLFVQWIINSVYGKKKDAPSKNRVLMEEDFKGAGAYYYEKNIDKLATPNPEWKKRATTIVKEGKSGKRIFKHNYVNRPVKLIEEPNNPNDPNAVAIMIAGELVGYIGRGDNIKVKYILNNREIISLSGFIGGGEYKIVHNDGTVFKDSKGHSVTVRIKYI